MRAQRGWCEPHLEQARSVSGGYRTRGVWLLCTCAYLCVCVRVCVHVRVRVRVRMRLALALAEPWCHASSESSESTVKQVLDSLPASRHAHAEEPCCRCSLTCCACPCQGEASKAWQRSSSGSGINSARLQPQQRPQQGHRW